MVKNQILKFFSKGFDLLLKKVSKLNVPYVFLRALLNGIVKINILMLSQ
jgi:hypothetical protein